MKIRSFIGLLAVVGALGCQRKEPLPEYGAVAEFSLIGQDKQAFRRDDLKGTPWVAAFMFTRCPTVCPRITARMVALQQRARAEQVQLRLVSFSVDPEHDTPEVLRAYALENEADLRSWTFATGDLEAIKRTSENSFKLALDQQRGADVDPSGVLHGSHLVLVDGEGKIRGYYESENEAALDKLLRDARGLATDP